jgi:hypothetical protein
MRPMEIARKWSECSLSKEYIKMQNEVEKLELRSRSHILGPTGLQESGRLIHQIDFKPCITKAT